MSEENTKISIITADTIMKTISDIALEKLKNDTKGFYSINFLMPSLETPTIQAEAGLSLGELFKVSAWAQYDINSKKIVAGARIGGDFSL